MTSGMSPVGIYLIKKILYIKLDIFKIKNNKKISKSIKI